MKTSDEILCKKHSDVLTKNKSEAEKLKESIQLTKEVSVKFGRFLLKEANHKWDKDLLLCWEIKNQEYDTLFLFEKFVKEYL